MGGGVVGRLGSPETTGEKASGSIPAVARLSGTSYLVLIIRIYILIRKRMG